MTLIELGEVSSGWAPGRPAAAPPPSVLRRIAVLAVAVLCVLTVTGSQRPEPRSLPTLWSVPYAGGQFTLTEDTLYVLGTGKKADLTAFDAADGSVRWIRKSHQPDSWLNTDVPGLLLVPVPVERKLEVDGETFVETVPATVALDARTGAERWRSAGEANLFSGDVALLTEWDPNGAGVDGFRAVRLSDGKVAWTLTPDSVSSRTTTGPEPGRPDRLVLSDGYGQVEVRRISDGSVVTRATVSPLPGWAGDQFPQLYSSGPMLMMIQADDRRQIMTAHDPDTLKRRWIRTIGNPPHYFDCGTLLCFAGGGDTVDAVDPLTGQDVWHSAKFDVAHAVPGTDRLLVEQRHSGLDGLLDGATGRRIIDFAPGATLSDPATSKIIKVGLNRTAPARAPVTQITGSGALVLRGSLSPVADDGCQLAGDRLACAHEGGTLSVREVG